MRVNRRTLLKGGGALMLAPAIGRYARGATSTINAVRLLQGGTGKLWSAIYGDTKTLGFPISATQIFMNIAAAFRNSMPKGYPGVYTIAGIYDMEGEPVFQVRLLPPNTAIPGSISNPSLQVLMTAGSAAGAAKVSYVIPEFTKIDGAYHTMQFVVGMWPQLTPSLFYVAASDLNNATGIYSAKSGFWTNSDGTNVLAMQLPPPAFYIPMINSGLSGDTNMVFSIGGPIKDRLGGYNPYGGQNQDLFSSPMDYTQLYLSARPPTGSPPPIVFPSFVAQRGPAAAILSAINATNVYASAATDMADLMNNNPPPATPVTAVWDEVSATLSSLGSTITTATKNNASTSVMTALMSARSSLSSAQQLLSTMSVISSPPAVDMETVYLLVDAAYNQTLAASAYSTADLAGSIQSAYTVPLVQIINNARTVTTVNSVGAATVISEGNATSVTTAVAGGGNIVRVDNGSGQSGLNNQVNNITMTNGGAAIQPAASDPSVTIVEIDITPDVP